VATKVRRPLREHELLLALRGEVARYLTYKMAAEHLGISAQYLTDVLQQRRAISARLAHALGYERQALFVPYEQRD
jgi:plasmid maintenance system antidote protein VapI